jgi:hypothetical protein
MQKPIAKLPDWELVLSAAAQLQHILPQAVLVVIHAKHGFSRDENDVLSTCNLIFNDLFD